MRTFRGSVVAVVVLLGGYGWALLVERWAGLRVDVVVQAVVVAAAFGRVSRGFGWLDWLVAGVVLPAAAAGGVEVGVLLRDHRVVGGVVFTAAVAAAIGVRRFGARAARGGSVVLLPLVAVLVVPASSLVAPHPGWVAVTAVGTVVWAGVVGLLGAAPALLLFLRPPASLRRPSAGVAEMARPRSGVHPSTRMAAQAAVALGAAFVVGRLVWPDHWAWVVLTAFLVGSGTRSRGDVLLKGAWRTLGAAAGTVVATVIAGAFAPHSDVAVVLIFVVLAVATWLRELSYAYWAGCVTAVLSLFYDWLGQDSGDLLRDRLGGIAVGAVIGVGAAWLVLPIRTSGLVRLRTSAALVAVAGLLDADWHDRSAVRVAHARFVRAADDLRLAAAPLRLAAPAGARRLARGTAALQRCIAPAAVIVAGSASLADDPVVARQRAVAAARARSARRALAGRPAKSTRGSGASARPDASRAEHGISRANGDFSRPDPLGARVAAEGGSTALATIGAELGLLSDALGARDISPE